MTASRQASSRPVRKSASMSCSMRAGCWRRLSGVKAISVNKHTAWLVFSPAFCVAVSGHDRRNGRSPSSEYPLGRRSAMLARGDAVMAPGTSLRLWAIAATPESGSVEGAKSDQSDLADYPQSDPGPAHDGCLRPILGFTAASPAKRRTRRQHRCRAGAARGRAFTCYRGREACRFLNLHETRMHRIITRPSRPQPICRLRSCLETLERACPRTASVIIDRGMWLFCGTFGIQ